MRIISGNLKGRLIDYIKNSITRPLKDNVRESIFNIIEHSKLIDISSYLLKDKSYFSSINYHNKIPLVL